MTGEPADRAYSWPTVTAVFLAYNRREELLLGLRKTFEELDYEPGLLDVIVVDNASGDGTAEAVRREYPAVHLIERTHNCGVSGWNDGFAVARGEWVVALDDDCYLPRDGLRRAIEEGKRARAQLVSFGVRSSVDTDYRFDVDEYRTGLFTFWGCAVAIRGDALEALHGYDPEIFVWANEVELMLRFFDRGFRHLHLPEVVAVHAKAPGLRQSSFPERPYRFNAQNFGYVAGKLLRGRDAARTLVALVSQSIRDGLRVDKLAFWGALEALKGFLRGVKHRQPVRAEVSRAYTYNFEDFSTPWEMSRSPGEIARDALRPGPPTAGDLGRREQWRADRARFYPEQGGVLEL